MLRLVAPALLASLLALGSACAEPYRVRPPTERPADAGAAGDPVEDEDAGVDEDDDAGPDAAFDAGDADAGPGVQDADAGVVDDRPREMRGLWITRFAFSDQAGLEGILERAAAAGFNAVFVQIRGNGDAYYASSLEPWARGLAGALGRDPGWDPLAVAVAKGHALGLEVHAYMNVFSAWPVSLLPVPQAEGPVQHPLFAHPEWLAVDDTGQNNDSEYAWFSPGNLDVRAHTVAVAREILESYDVDGLHLDRIRTAGPMYSRDDASLERFAAAQAVDPSLSYDDFMREQVTAMVAEIYDVLVEVRPTAALSAAVWGIHTALPGCSTSEGAADYHQDSWEWARRGVIDALAPMTYWSIDEGACTDWAALIDGFVAEAAPRHVWAGMHALDRVGGAQTFAPDEIRARIEHARAAGALGTVLFASTYLEADAARWAAFRGTEQAPGPFAEDAAVPPLPWRP